MIEREVLLPIPPRAALHIAQADGGPHRHPLGIPLLRHIYRAVGDVCLEVPYALFTARVGEPQLAPLVLRQPPLPAVWRGGFLHGVAVRRPAQPVGVVSRVEPIIHRPSQPARLVLHVSAARSTFIKWALRLRHAVAVFIRPRHDVVRVRLADEHLVLQGLHHARDEQAVGKNRVLIKDPVCHLVARDSRLRCDFIGALDVLHIRAHLHDVEAPISVKRHRHWLFDVRLAEHQLKRVAVAELDCFQFLRCRHRWEMARWRQVFGQFRCGESEDGSGDDGGEYVAHWSGDDSTDVHLLEKHFYS